MSVASSCIINDLTSLESAWFEWSLDPIPMTTKLITYASCSIGCAMKSISREALFLVRKDFLPYQRRKGEKDKRFTAQTFLG